MDIDFVQIALGLAFVLAAIVFYFFGLAQGRRRERDRVLDLLHSAIQRRFSGSVRWVWSAVQSGKYELMDQDKFFGPERPSDKPPVN